jgi:hypothetical protein
MLARKGHIIEIALKNINILRLCSANSHVYEESWSNKLSQKETPF